MKSDASSRLDERVTALEEGGGGDSWEHYKHMEGFFYNEGIFDAYYNTAGHLGKIIVSGTTSARSKTVQAPGVAFVSISGIVSGSSEIILGYYGGSRYATGVVKLYQGQFIIGATTSTNTEIEIPANAFVGEYIYPYISTV